MATTWEELTALEPQLLTLLGEAKAVRDNRRKKSFCANAVWYGRGDYDGFRSRLCDLVGFRRKDDPVLGTILAFDIAYHTVYNALPDCRNCACCGFQDIVNERMPRRRAGQSTK